MLFILSFMAAAAEAMQSAGSGMNSGMNSGACSGTNAGGRAGMDTQTLIAMLMMLGGNRRSGGGANAGGQPAFAGGAPNTRLGTSPRYLPAPTSGHNSGGVSARSAGDRQVLRERLDAALTPGRAPSNAAGPNAAAGSPMDSMLGASGSRAETGSLSREVEYAKSRVGIPYSTSNNCVTMVQKYIKRHGGSTGGYSDNHDLLSHPANNMASMGGFKVEGGRLRQLDGYGKDHNAIESGMIFGIGEPWNNSRAKPVAASPDGTAWTRRVSNSHSGLIDQVKRDSSGRVVDFSFYHTSGNIRGSHYSGKGMTRVDSFVEWSTQKGKSRFAHAFVHAPKGAANEILAADGLRTAAARSVPSPGRAAAHPLSFPLPSGAKGIDAQSATELRDASGRRTAFSFKAPAMIDADGGHDSLGDPYYQKTTSLRWSKNDPKSGRPYANALEIPYMVLPKNAYYKGLAKPGDLAKISYNGREVYALVGDFGPDHKTGELSVRAAQDLGIPASPVSGGVSSKSVTYTVIPGSGRGVHGGPPLSHQEIQRLGADAFRRTLGRDN